MVLANAILKSELEFVKITNPELFEKALIIYASITKWQRELTEDEARDLTEYIINAELERKSNIINIGLAKIEVTKKW